MQEGKFTGKIKGYTAKDINDKAAVEVLFEVEGQGSVSWTGYMTPNAMERTFKTLSTMGLKKDISALADPTSNALDVDSDYLLTIQHTKKNGIPTQYFEARFVDRPGKKLEAANTETKTKLAQVSSQWAAYMAANGIKKEDKPLPF